MAPDGKISFEDENGTPLPPALIKRIRDEQPQAVTRALEQLVGMINADLDACLSVHLGTPPPDVFRGLPEPPPPDPKPEPPDLRPIRWWDRLLFRRGAIEAENERRRRSHAEAVEDWEQDVLAARAEAQRVRAINEGVRAGRQADMEALLAERLGEIAWAKETEVAFDFGSDSRTLDLELDLPSLDEMPHRSAAMPARGVNLKISKRSDAQRRRDFVRLAAGSVMRVAGEALAALPSVEEVTVSAFTQRPCPATGNTLDVYLLSVRIRRQDWTEIDFRALGQIEPEAALARFDLRMKPERNGALREIEPHERNVALISSPTVP